MDFCTGKMVYGTGRKNGECLKKRRSRDAARSRRGQQNDGYSELASQLPLPGGIAGQLDRLCVMRLVNSYIKMKQLMDSMTNQAGVKKLAPSKASAKQPFDSDLLQALDGFLFVVTADGQCLHISDNVSNYMGLSQTEVCGNSLYKYVHPCDHEELANQLGGHIPLEDGEIFDGLFCSESVFMMNNLLKGGSKCNHNTDNPYRSFSLRMKSTLTSRGKSVNLKASTYRVVHCTGFMKMKTTVNTDGTVESKPHCLIAIAVPLMVASSFEVPLDRCTFTSQHSLDMKILSCDDKMQTILGYTPAEVVGKSWYNFLHAGDQDTALACHKTLLTKGQSVSKYYRLLVRGGGWVWFQTRAHVVYDSKTCQPQFILCINYQLGGMEKRDTVLTNEQVNPVPVPGALSALQNADKPKRAKQGKRRKGDSILLQERNKVLKSSANHRQAMSNRAMGAVKKESGKSDCTLKGVQDKPQTRGTSIEQLNFQDFPPLTWDIGNDFLTPIVSEDEHRAAPSLVVKEEHQQLQPQKGTTPVKRGTKQQEENFDERAPFIPLPDVDAALEMDDETLMDIPFLSSPFSWLTEEDIPVDKGRVTPTPSEQTTEMGPQNNAGYLMGKGAHGLLNSAGKYVPLVTQLDAEVNAPLEANYLLQGEDLLRALESGLLTY